MADGTSLYLDVEFTIYKEKPEIIKTLEIYQPTVAKTRDSIQSALYM
jgi:hypothetical protein